MRRTRRTGPIATRGRLRSHRLSPGHLSGPVSAGQCSRHEKVNDRPRLPTGRQSPISRHFVLLGASAVVMGAAVRGGGEARDKTQVARTVIGPGGW